MESSKSVLVIGATGFLGMEICRQLTDAKINVKAMVRTSSDHMKVKELEHLGAEIVLGDIKDKASLKEAFKNISSVISTATSTLSRIKGDSIESVDLQGQLNVIKAAQEAEVDKFIFLSFPESRETFPLQDAKRSAEKALMESGVDYTILRPSFFMEIWLGPYLGFDIRNHKATIYGEGVNETSWISLKDVAAFAVMSLQKEECINKIIELGGAEALSPLAIVRMAENESGCKFDLQFVPEEVIRNQKEKSTDMLEQSFSALMLTVASGGEINMNETLQFLPVRLTSVNDYIHETIAQKLEPAF